MKLARREDVFGDMVSPKHKVGGKVYTYHTDKQLDLDWVWLDRFVLHFIFWKDLKGGGKELRDVRDACGWDQGCPRR